MRELTLAEAALVSGGLTNEEIEAIMAWRPFTLEELMSLTPEQRLAYGVDPMGSSNPSDSTNPYPAAPPHQWP
ncbi:hypothetical protein [Caulobacter endophyticus]|uniref:hypothetical protein n=1 Tax=Caulobacter endophyticus TaxID=2172652 RepID=UPI00241097E1|nr:hypothetical protein [Caulobacter endophyticus]MDG2527520.1 hypothetical protein [Caulobacter endophyticus]